MSTPGLDAARLGDGCAARLRAARRRTVRRGAARRATPQVGAEIRRRQDASPPPPASRSTVAQTNGRTGATKSAKLVRARLEQINRLRPGAARSASASLARPAASRSGPEPGQNLVPAQPHDVLLVEPVELLRIEHGVAAADALEREPRDEFVAREHFLIAAPGDHPSSARKLTIASGQVALLLVLSDGRRAMALAEALLVGAENQRHVRERAAPARSWLGTAAPASACWRCGRRRGPHA